MASFKTFFTASVGSSSIPKRNRLNSRAEALAGGDERLRAGRLQLGGQDGELARLQVALPPAFGRRLTNDLLETEDAVALWREAAGALVGRTARSRRSGCGRQPRRFGTGSPVRQASAWRWRPDVALVLVELASGRDARR